MSRRIVTLTTDFGRDWYAGALRGAILRRAPGATVVDITHDVPAHDVRAGAFALAAACTAFPPGSIHLAVIDPGVGGRRRPLALAVGQDALVGPDNGVLSLAVGALRQANASVAPVRAFVLDPVRVGCQALSDTFHGRDLFAPAAGALADGVAIESLGDPTTDWIDLGIAPPLPSADEWELAVAYVDTFGNAVTNLPADGFDAEAWEWRPGKPDDGTSVQLHRAYEDVEPGGSLLICGSAGYLEVAVREGRADQLWRLARGSHITLRRRRSAAPTDRPPADARRTP